MFRRTLPCLALLLLACAAWAADPPAGDPRAIEGETFRMALPKGWQVQNWGPPAEVHGVQGEVMLVSAVVPDREHGAGDDPSQSKAYRKFWRERITHALKGISAEPGMQPSQPLTETQLQGQPFFASAAHDPTRHTFVQAYGLIGRAGTVFLVTLEGPIAADAGARKAVRSMFEGIHWKRGAAVSAPAAPGRQATPTVGPH